MARLIESRLIDGPTGELECLIEAPGDAAPRALAVVCHPHPLFGGTMHNKVVYRVARALRNSGYAVLRFNFRGVGQSAGRHTLGVGEVDDARMAVDYLRGRYPDLPYTLAGFSFGSRVILNLGCLTRGAQRLIALGFPAKRDPVGILNQCTSPKVFIQSTHDEYGPPPEMEALYAQVAEPKRLIWVEAEDHFFAGGLDELEREVRELDGGPSGPPLSS